MCYDCTSGQSPRRHLAAKPGPNSTENVYTLVPAASLDTDRDEGPQLAQPLKGAGPRAQSQNKLAQT